MREKNLKTRQDIMRAAYSCFSQTTYKDVFLKDISEAAGIKKPLLQYYYPQKHLLISEMMAELLEHSFKYFDELAETKEANIHIRLAVFTAVIWMACDVDEQFGSFLGNAYRTEEVFDFVMERTYKWLKTLLIENKMAGDLLSLRFALEYSVSGGMHIYFRREKFDLTPQKIMEEISITFMRMMGCSSEERYSNIAETRKIVEKTDLNQFLNYCKLNIGWMR